MEADWLRSRIEEESTRLETSENKKEELESQRNELEDVKNTVEGDEELQIAIASIEEKLRGKEREAIDEMESAYLEFVDLQDQLEHMLAQNRDSLESMSRLREQGIDVSETETELQERRMILQECQVRLGHISERLIGAEHLTEGSLGEVRSRLQGAYQAEMEMLAHSIREARRPSEMTDGGERRGSWEGDCFVLDDRYVPAARYNPEGKTIAEIAEDLKSEYGIELGPIPFRGDEADFSELAVASVDAGAVAKQRGGPDLEEIVTYGTPTREETVSLLQDTAEIFRTRDRNMHAADVILAKTRVYIPTLGDDYTAEQLADWRQKHSFTWDEQLGGGYLLIPSVIHSSVAHTGLVSKTKDAAAAYER